MWMVDNNEIEPTIEFNGCGRKQKYAFGKTHCVDHLNWIGGFVEDESFVMFSWRKIY